MSEPELHPVTKTPWTCACRQTRARDCYEARYPSQRLPFEDDGYSCEPDDVCGCSCHDWEGDEEDPYDDEEGRW